MFFSVITKNLNWEISEHLITFERYINQYIGVVFLRGGGGGGLIPQCRLR